MTAPDVLPHVDSVQAALQAGGLTVYLGGAPEAPAARYCVLYPDPGRAVSESLADRRTDLAFWVTVTCVGPTAEQALWVAGRVRQALDAPLTVAGRRMWRAEDHGGPSVARDNDVTPPVFFLPVEYYLQSTSA